MKKKSEKSIIKWKGAENLRFRFIEVKFLKGYTGAKPSREKIETAERVVKNLIIID
jgi:hypothetical protein